MGDKLGALCTGPMVLSGCDFNGFRRVVGCRSHVIVETSPLHSQPHWERFYKTMANTSTAPMTVQQIALPRSPANQNPLAALKQRIALVHPLTNAPGLLSILRNFHPVIHE